MAEPASFWARRIILERDPADLDVIPDELFMDLEDAPGTQFLAATCYGQAVTECLRIGEDQYILKVNKDLRMLLLKQLKFFYKTYQVYRYSDEDDSRLILTGELHLWFAPSASGEERCRALSECIQDADRLEEPQNGMYRLAEGLTPSPVAVSLALQREGAVEQATPVIVDLPHSSEWVSQDAPTSS